MKFPRASLAFALLLACGGAFAQQAAIEQQMTPDQFKAAGLDKLSPQELANLNAWLNRTLETETAKAATEAKKKIEAEDRGFFHFNSDEPIVGHIVGEFRSFAKGRRYTLDNGQEWVQIDDAELSGVRLTNPEVRIKPAMVGNTWYMSVGKYNTKAQVKRVK
jgi:hypothetical protein